MELKNSIQKQIYDQAINISNEVYKELVEDPLGINKIPESLFVNYFLPLFSGELSFEEANRRVVEWYQIAGVPQKEVDIFDTSGTVIFRVPSIFNSDSLNIMRKEGAPCLKDVMTEYDMGSQGLPLVAERRLIKHLDKKVESMLSKKIDLSPAQKRWSVIFDKYKKPNPFKEEVKNSSSVKSSYGDVDIIDD